MASSRIVAGPLPIVAAPMAGGATTVASARAVADAGGFAFLAGGYKTAPGLAEQIDRLRATTEVFGVNLFVPGTDDLDATAFRTYADRLRPEADRFGLTLETFPVVDDDHWHDKLALLLEQPVAVVSLTFGLPGSGNIARLRRAGSRVLATVTTVDEARAAHESGVDGLVVQGPSAGGHSATFDPRRPHAPITTVDLVRQVTAAVPLPVTAAGGVDGPVAVCDLLAAGAEAVAIGTLLLRADESGASTTHKNALADPTFTETVVTHAFTGRPARALRNGFVDRHHTDAPLGYPAIHHLTRPLRQAAAAAGDADRLHLWAGTGFRAARQGPVETILRDLTSKL